MKKNITPLICFLIIFITLFGCTTSDKPLDKPEEPVNEITEQEKAVDNVINHIRTVYNPLTGKYLQYTGKPIAVMINNLYMARPQTGLNLADVVYEAEVEGNITRFMAIFNGKNPDIVGSVRSARPYFLDLIKPWNCYYVHVGGSTQAYIDIPKLGIKNIDNMRGDRGFSFDNSRQAPHNTYFDIQTALQKKQSSINLPGWYKEAPPAAKADYRSIKFTYNKQNSPGYIWDDKMRVYLRTINDQPHNGRDTGKQIAVDNIIFQYARHIYSGDELGHIDIILNGQGKAEYFLGGKHSTGIWQRNGYGHILYLDDQGKPVQMVSGNTWIQIVRPNTKLQLEPYKE